MIGFGCNSWLSAVWSRFKQQLHGVRESEIRKKNAHQNSGRKLFHFRTKCHFIVMSTWDESKTRHSTLLNFIAFSSIFVSRINMNYTIKLTLRCENSIVWSTNPSISSSPYTKVFTVQSKLHFVELFSIVS